MEQLDPVEYPKVKLGDQELEVRYTCGSILRLKKEFNIDLDAMSGQPLKGAAAIERTLALLAVGISAKTVLTIDEIADQIDLRNLPVYAAAINEALKKAAPQAPTDETKKPVVQ
jgi:hypothetical protein